MRMRERKKTEEEKSFSKPSEKMFSYIMRDACTLI
jgi:hypothetical protein